MIIPERIIISRTDSIGDVVLTLPLAGELKKRIPGIQIIFLGRDYTHDVVRLSANVDEFISWDAIAALDPSEQITAIRKLNADTLLHVFPQRRIARLASASGIPNRIGTTGRIYHFRHCNKLVRFRRKNSDLHEAQLNFKLLKPIVGDRIPLLTEIADLYGMQVTEQPDHAWSQLLDGNRFNLVLHPKSKGSAREWPLENYGRLIGLLPEDRFNIFISGTAAEGALLRNFLQEHQDRVTDLTGKFTLGEYIRFINAADGLLAASTGPLHIAAALGKAAVGLYPPIRPMHPGRWAPVGEHARHLVVDRACSDCRQNLDCHCMAEISPEEVASIFLRHAE